MAADSYLSGKQISGFSPGPARILRVVEDRSARRLTLITDRASKIAAPRIQFVRSDKGLQLMLADFADLKWVGLPHSIKLGKDAKFEPDVPRPKLEDRSSADPVQAASVKADDTSNPEFICFSQEPLSPPVLRVSAGANSAEAFRNLSFASNETGLTVHWGTEPNNQGKNNAPKDQGIDRALALDQRQLQGQPPDLARVERTDRPALLFSSESLATSCFSGANHGKSAALRDCRGAEEEVVAESPDLAFAQIASAPPQVAFRDDAQNLLEIISPSRISFKSFRLREPERFVIDFDNVAGFDQIELPPVAENPFVRELRAGLSKNKTLAGRLVCDLASETIAVAPELSADGHKLILTLSDAPERAAFDFKAGARVILDPGHGGSDPGAQRGLVQEKDITLPIVYLLKRELEQIGLKVVLTRKDDSFVSLQERVAITNQLCPDLFLSVHINSLNTDSNLQGIETYFQTAQSRLLADCIHESLVNHLAASDRAVRRARFYVINHTTVPAVLAEVGFISCKEERQKLISSEYQNQIARALAQGVMLYLTKRSELVAVDQTALGHKQLSNLGAHERPLQVGNLTDNRSQ